MALVTEFFSAHLSTRLGAGDIHLPLTCPAQADLMHLLSEPGDYIYLTISAERGAETVKVFVDEGALMLERGIEGTEAVNHRYGASVCSISPTIMAAIKDLVCNYQCCEPECPCTPVTAAGNVLPVGHRGMEWSGTVIFSGGMPMYLGCNGIPSWMQASQVSNAVVLSGIPQDTGTYTFSVAATNCNGTAIASQEVTVTVQE